MRGEVVDLCLRIGASSPGGERRKWSHSDGDKNSSLASSGHRRRLKVGMPRWSDLPLGQLWPTRATGAVESRVLLGDRAARIPATGATICDPATPGHCSKIAVFQIDLKVPRRSIPISGQPGRVPLKAGRQASDDRSKVARWRRIRQHAGGMGDPSAGCDIF